MIWKWHRTCNAETHDDNILLESNTVYCDLREHHEGKHEGIAKYVTGKEERWYW